MVIRKEIVVRIIAEAQIDVPGAKPDWEPNKFEYWKNGDLILSSFPHDSSFPEPVTLRGKLKKDFETGYIKFAKTLEDIEKDIKEYTKGLIAKTEYKIYREVE